MEPRLVAGVPKQSGSAALVDADAPALRGSRAVVEAVRRIDEFVVRCLGIARCGLWSVAPDGHRAICVDVFGGDSHRRDPDRDSVNVAALHRRLDSAGIVAASAERGDLAGLLPPGASAALAVAVHRGSRVAAYLCAEQTGVSRGWTAEEQCLMKSIADVVREVFAVIGDDAVVASEHALLDQLPAVAYRGARIGDEWRLTLVSAGVERVLGVRADELIGEPVHALRRLLADVPPSLPAAGDYEHGYRRQPPGGVLRRFSEKGRVRSDAGNGAKVVEGFIVEITGSVDAASDAVEQYELLTHVGHELRTPLNAILGFAQLIDLEIAGTAAQRHEHVTQIQRAGRHLLEVIREMMDFSRLQAGPIDLQLESVELAQLVEDTLPLVANQAAQAGVLLVNSVLDRELHALADPRPLGQALVNLLSNAVKYNRNGGRVVVDCELRGETVRLRVTDTGIGLTAQQKRSLFQPFNRLGMERSEIEGVGLGLVITRRLVEAMGGRIEVTSRSGAGSTFEIALPVAEA